MKLVRQLHLTSHFWDAFEAGDGRVLETLLRTADWPEGPQREGSDLELWD